MNTLPERVLRKSIHDMMLLSVDWQNGLGRAKKRKKSDNKGINIKSVQSPLVNRQSSV
jgi:hypothetical protein